MDCQEITQPAVAMQIIQTPQDPRLQRLFGCIYSLFQASFLKWILQKYNSPRKDKLWEDAKDAFQNGILALYLKVQQKGFLIKNSLKTTVYSFGLLQLLAVFKRERLRYISDDYLKCFELFFEDDLLEAERQDMLNERESNLLQALQSLPKKQRDILEMRFFEKLKSKQIAERLDVSASNVDNESAKAYRMLRSILQDKHPLKHNSHEVN